MNPENSDNDPAQPAVNDPAQPAATDPGQQAASDPGQPADGEVPEEVDDDATELEFEDTLEIEANKDELWGTISDPEVLARCVPGAENIERNSERVYTVEITRGLSSLTISLSGDIELVEMNEPDWIVASGNAYDPRSHSDFEGLAAMEMNSIGANAVELNYKAELTFTGGVASIPARIVSRIIRSDVDAYFENIKGVVEV